MTKSADYPNDPRPSRRFHFLSNKAKIETSVLFGGWDEKVEVSGKTDCGHLGLGDVGFPVAEVFRKHGISNALYYQWKSKYAGVSVNELTRVLKSEAENNRLKKMYAELALDLTAIKDVPSRKL
jgi:putative transposase